MTQVKIDEDIYLLLEKKYTSKDYEFTNEEYIQIQQFFLRKWKKRYDREQYKDNVIVKRQLIEKYADTDGPDRSSEDFLEYARLVEGVNFYQ